MLLYINNKSYLMEIHEESTSLFKVKWLEESTPPTESGKNQVSLRYYNRKLMHPYNEPALIETKEHAKNDSQTQLESIETITPKEKLEKDENRKVANNCNFKNESKVDSCSTIVENKLRRKRARVVVDSSDSDNELPPTKKPSESKLFKMIQNGKQINRRKKKVKFNYVDFK